LDQAISLSNGDGKNKATNFVHYVYDPVVRFDPIFKINEFQEDKEWRIIYKTPFVEKETLGVLTLAARYDIEFINTMNNLRSYFMLKIDATNFTNSVTGIINAALSEIFFELVAK
jgi:hypothetical protein